jgi:hypothetical protein
MLSQKNIKLNLTKFVTLSSNVDFFIFMSCSYTIESPCYGPEFDSAYNKNLYQEYFWGVKGGRRVMLTTSASSVS